MLTAAVVTASAADFAFGSRSYCSLSSSVLEYTLSAAPPALRVASPNDDAVVAAYAATSASSTPVESSWKR